MIFRRFACEPVSFGAVVDAYVPARSNRAGPELAIRPQFRPYLLQPISAPASNVASSCAKVWSMELADAGLPQLDFPLHDRTIAVTTCGRICFNRQKITLSQVLCPERTLVSLVPGEGIEPPTNG